MGLQVEKQGNLVKTKIFGSFNFEMRAEFQRAVFGHPSGTRFEVDFAEVRMMDSLALGMMVLLREMAGGDDSDITLINCSQFIKKQLTLAQFHKLFKIC